MAGLESSTVDQKVPCKFPVLLVAETPVGVKLTSIRIFNTPLDIVAATLGASYTLACEASPIAEVIETPVIDTIAPPVTELTSFTVEVIAFPLAVAVAPPVAVSSPRDAVVPIPVKVRLQSPVIVIVPGDDVIPFPATSTVCGKVPAVDVIPCSVTTIVKLLSPDIEKVPIDDVD